MTARNALGRSASSAWSRPIIAGESIAHDWKPPGRGLNHRRPAKHNAPDLDPASVAFGTKRTSNRRQKPTESVHRRTPSGTCTSLLCRLTWTTGQLSRCMARSLGRKETANHFDIEVPADCLWQVRCYLVPDIRSCRILTPNGVTCCRYCAIELKPHCDGTTSRGLIGEAWN
jgi:hypothetical protein